MFIKLLASDGNIQGAVIDAIFKSTMLNMFHVLQLMLE